VVLIRNTNIQNILGCDLGKSTKRVSHGIRRVYSASRRQAATERSSPPPFLPFFLPSFLPSFFLPSFLPYLLTSWLFGSLTALVSLLTDAHSSLSSTFCRHFLIFISLLYIFQLSQSTSSTFSSSFRFTLKYCLNCPSQTQSCYMSNPFQSLLLKSSYYV